MRKLRKQFRPYGEPQYTGFISKNGAKQNWSPFMNMVQSIRPFLVLCLTGLTLLSAACGKIPDAYQGKFLNSANGTRLELQSGGGTLVYPNGEKSEVEAKSLDTGDLIQLKKGLYLRDLKGSPDILEVFWISPKPETREEGAGTLWFKAEILYTRMKADQKSKVKGLRAQACRIGTVIVDLEGKSFVAACDEELSSAEFMRLPSFGDP